MRNSRFHATVYNKRDQLSMIRKDWRKLELVEFQSVELVREALSISPDSKRCIRNYHGELAFEDGHSLAHTLKRDGHMLRYVPHSEQTELLCQIAVMSRGTALQFVVEQTKAIVTLAVRQNGMSIQHANIPLDNAIEILAVVENYQALQFIESPEALDMAVVMSPFVDEDHVLQSQLWPNHSKEIQ